VLQAIDGLKLEPADRNEGQATFIYEFKPAATCPGTVRERR
jgi:hypothetical protein